ncbi:MAG TPA: tetratricopeptide repeat protein, partial [Kofleriaceae bacterium]|nr:tetratricopeptide repeat protein [Kofleriaceae bacterium]
MVALAALRVVCQWVARGSSAVALVLLLAAWAPFEAPDPEVLAGNQAYAEGRWDDALAHYQRAHPRVDQGGLAYNRGTTLLRKAERLDPAAKDALIAQALGELQRAATSLDRRVRSAAAFNRGNVLLGQDKLEEAIEAYKSALRDEPESEDARANLEAALRRRKKQQAQQQPGQQGQQPGQQGQQGQQPGQQGQQGQQPGQQGQQGQQPGQQGQQPGQQGQ